MGMSSGSVKVKRKYEELLSEMGSELHIIREAPIDLIEEKAGALVAQGIKNLREGKVEAIAGYDGEYGKISVLSSADRDKIEGQLKLFEFDENTDKKPKKEKIKKIKKQEEEQVKTITENEKNMGLNDRQLEAAKAQDKAVAVIAGPGTGKTKTLICRIAFLINEYGVDPSDITAVTFTNKAARELRERLEVMFKGKRSVKSIKVGTFHSICLKHIKNAEIASEAEALETAESVIKSLGLKDTHVFSQCSFIKKKRNRQKLRWLMIYMTLMFPKWIKKALWILMIYL